MDFQLDPEALSSFSEFKTAANRVAREQAKKTPRGAPKSKGGSRRPGQSRKPYEDTPLTRTLVYRIKDITSKTVHICVGVGKAELVVKSLEMQGHTLYLFRETKSGARLRTPMPYQCIIDSRGKSAGYCYSWRPTEKYTSIVVHSDKETDGLLLQSDWPYHVGGTHLRVAVANPDADPTDLEQRALHLGREYEDEMALLKRAKDRGQVPAKYVISPEEWLRATAEWLDVVVTPETLEQLRTHLRRNVISWPPSPAQMAELRKGGTLFLEPDMTPKDDRPVVRKTMAPIGDYDEHVQVVMHPELAKKPELRPEYKVVGWRADGESAVLTAGGAHQCQQFACSERMHQLASQGFTHYQILTRDEQPASERTPVPPCYARHVAVVTTDYDVTPDDSGARLRKALLLALSALDQAAAEAPDVPDWQEAIGAISDLVWEPEE